MIDTGAPRRLTGAMKLHPVANQSVEHAAGRAPGLGAFSDIDVLLTTEGTYPYVTGGVSTWAHQLVTGLAEKQFVVYSVVANTSMPVRY